jgi:hypothetical protein
MPWATPKFTHNEVRKAGDVLINPPSLPSNADWSDSDYQNWELYDHALGVISNWRSAHGYPLWVFQRTLRTKATALDDHSLVSQRLKRLPAIRLKLRLHPNMALSQMQDIGGCRAVLHSVHAVNRLVSIYEKSSLNHVCRRKTDYILSPRTSGYRGVHMIYRFQGRHEGPYDGLQIEMQIRSEYQHVWATAVEAVGTLLSQALKSSQGQDAWLRFFAIMGTAVALKEGTPPVPNTPSDPRELNAELKRTRDELQVEAKLRIYGTALETVGGQQMADARFFLLQLDSINEKLTITPFKAAEMEKANAEYLRIEKAIAGQAGKEAVLVSVNSLAALRRAYPSYFLDTKRFLDLLAEVS